jgi:hypothetical protein
MTSNPGPSDSRDSAAGDAGAATSASGTAVGLPAGGHRRERVEDDDEPEAAGVDDPRAGQLGQLVGRGAQRGGRRPRRRHRDGVEPIRPGGRLRRPPPRRAR